MVNRRVLLGSASALLAQALVSSAQNAGGRKILFEQDTFTRRSFEEPEVVKKGKKEEEGPAE